MLASAVVLLFKLLSAIINRALMKGLFLFVLIFFVAGILKQGKEGGELVYTHGANVKIVKIKDDALFDCKDDLSDYVAEEKEAEEEAKAAAEAKKTEEPKKADEVKSTETVTEEKAETPEAEKTEAAKEEPTATEAEAPAAESETAATSETATPDTEANATEAVEVEKVTAAPEAQPEVATH
jgi:cytoskeletal protein RodZ